ncbi:2TM domain-containing protein [Flavobacterium sp. LB1P71]|uniref:2TM domain-containing protein n=1 Tax=unclassified Flavobacterium TaxID=196869 RepID=UPI003AAB3F4D
MTEPEVILNRNIMENNNQNGERYYKAKKRVEEIKGFYGNLVAYIVVNIGLLAINLLTSPKHLWFYWPMLGWGIGVVFHGMKVFNYMPFIGKDWEEKKIKEFMDKEKENKETWR